MGAALLPSAPIVHHDPGVKRVFERAELYKEIGGQDLTAERIKEGIRNARLLDEEEKNKKK